MIGKTISHYRILEKLGGGGMGVVYKAEDTKLGRMVALKVLPPERVADPNRKRRFVQEARAASALNHPNIITIYDIDEAEGVHYIAMEYVEGKTLDRLIARHGLRVNEALKYAVQMATALAKAHSAGIVHRDLKPTNMMVTDDGLVKVLDFGLAKLTEAAPTGDAETAVTREPTTEEGTIVGTVGYMSPEQAEGKAVDARSDIFSFGSVLYEMLTGQRAFQGETKVSTIAAILREEPKPLSQIREGLPREVERIVRRCLRKDPAHRFQHMDDLKVALEELKEESDSGELAATAKAEKKRLSRTALAAIAVATVALLAVAAVVAYILWPRPQAPAQRTLTRLTFDPGLQSDPSFSPDGRFIAYSSDRSGNFDIWVQQIGGGDPVQVTKSPAHDWQPDWSPDGKQIVFRSERDRGGLYVVPALGGHETKVSSFGYRPRWSPDGSRILFRSTILREVSEPLRVYIVGLDGNPPHEVLAGTLTAAASDTSVAWHPDGQRVSIRLRQPGEPQGGFWTVPVAGGAPVKSELATQVEEQLKVASASLEDFVWAPSGRALYFQGTSRDVRNLWKISADPTTLRWVGGPERLTTGPGQDTALAISADSKRLGFVARTESLRIWSIPFDAAKGRTTGEGQPVTAAGMDADCPDLTRDGSKLVFLAVRAGKEELWAKSLTDGRETLLVAEANYYALRWSRDGTRLAYRRAHPTTGEFQMVLLPAGGGTEEVLTSPGRRGVESNPWDWSLDGRWLLGGCYTPGRRVEIGLLPVSAAPHAEAQARVVASNPEYNLWQGRFSPDDRWVCFNAVRAAGIAGSAINVVPAAGGDWIPITDGKYHDDKPRWSPDGKIIYFVSSRGGFMNVWGRRFDPTVGKPVGEPFQVTRFESPGRMPSDYIGGAELGVAANRLVLPIMEATGSIWMLENVDR
jgi:Tol biopolymer transport system component/predicted Ser/Thr protein kinase